MARRKSLFKLPFLKIKINRNTIFNIIGFLLIASGLLLLLSFFANDTEEGRILFVVNEYVFNAFGFLAFFTPFLVFLVAAHFFSSKKLKVIKPNITIGGILIFLSFLGIFQGGEWGKFIYSNLSTDFSVAGALIILSVIFFIGLILFLDTSVDSFVMFLVKTLGGFFSFLKNYVFREMLNREPGKAKGKDDGFIKDHGFQINKPEISKLKPVPPQGVEMHMRPVTTSSSKWVYPPITILQDVNQKEADRGDVKQNADTIEKTLDSFGIKHVFINNE